MEKLPEIVRNIQELLLEIIMWIILIPKTLTKIIVYPKVISPYISEELKKEEEGNKSFLQYVHPIFLYILLVGLPSINIYEMTLLIPAVGSVSPNVVNQSSLVQSSDTLDVGSLTEQKSAVDSSSFEDRAKKKLLAAFDKIKKFRALPLTERLLPSLIPNIIIPVSNTIALLLIFPVYYERRKIKEILFNQLYIITPFALTLLLLTMIIYGFTLNYFFLANGKPEEQLLKTGILILTGGPGCITFFAIFIWYWKVQFRFIKNHFSVTSFKAVRIFLLMLFLSGLFTSVYAWLQVKELF